MVYWPKDLYNINQLTFWWFYICFLNGFSAGGRSAKFGEQTVGLIYLPNIEGINRTPPALPIPLALGLEYVLPDK